jgi:CheY-like chemotaxis protein
LEIVNAPEHIQFTVWDTGIGIAEQDMNRLFQPFVQLDSSLARSYSGTGLGLSLVHRLVELHGGHVTVESELDKGSRFTVSLPWGGPLTELPNTQSAVQNQFAPASLTERLRLKQTPLSTSSLLTEQKFYLPPSARILLVEDSEQNIITLSDYLTFKNFDVIVARNGLEAIEQAKALRPDLILMDIQMPKMDGLEATRRLRANADLQSIPIIALTALAMPGDQEQCYEAGVDDYLSKPISLKKLVTKIETYLKP